jgi:hypothetical protein
LKLTCDGLLSNFAFNFNLRRYNEGQTVLTGEAWRECYTVLPAQSSVLYCGDYLIEGREEQMIEVMPAHLSDREFPR